MVLSKKHIIEKIKSGEIQFEPMIDGFQLQPHSVDLRLGYDFHIPRTWELTKEGRKVINIDPFSENNKSNFDKVSLNPGQSFEILPKEYIIATTLEVITIKSKELMAILFPRSSVNRRGLAVDLSGIIDVGYHGKLMIPIVNNTHEQIIKIYPGERICQIIFEKISSQISPKQILNHGLAKAKYHAAIGGFLPGKTDRLEEINLIKKGKISQLKQKFFLKI